MQAKSRATDAGPAGDKKPPLHRSSSCGNASASNQGSLDPLMQILESQKEHQKQILALEKLQIDQRDQIEQYTNRVKQLDTLISKHGIGRFDHVCPSHL
jgi:hypothetical protein